MSDHALLVGCDAYPEVPGGTCGPPSGMPCRCANGCCRRAGWLARTSPCTRAAAIRAPGQRRARLTDPPAGPSWPGPSLGWWKGPGRRLYVYFAGHGCQTDPLNALQSRDAILLSGFTPDSQARPASVWMTCAAA